MKKYKPNFFDILFIVVILVVAAAAYLLSHDLGFSTKKDALASRSYLIELTDLDEDMADCVSVGDEVIDNIRNYSMGHITDISVIPATSSVLDEEARVVRQTPIEKKITLLLTIEANTLEEDETIQTDTGFLLRTGSSVSVTVRELTASGYILAVDREGGEPLEKAKS